MTLTSMLAALFSGEEKQTDQTHAVFTKIMFHETADNMSPYYCIALQKNGSYLLQAVWQNLLDQVNRNESGFAFFDLLKGMECEYKRILDAAEVQAISDALVQGNAPAWDGFHVYMSPDPDVLDGGDAFLFMCEYQDGTQITAEGSHARPDHFRQFTSVLYPILFRVTE